jgi:hypothetical protein
VCGTALLEDAASTRQACRHILIESGLRPVALRLILSGDLPFSSFGFAIANPNAKAMKR